MKKILFINGHLNAGGCERSLTDLLRNINFQEYDVDLLLLEDLGDYLEEIPNGVNVIFYPLGRAFGSFGHCMLNAIKKKDWFSFWYRLIHLYSTKFGVKKIKHARRLFPKVKKHYDTIIAYRPGICTDLAAFAFSADKKISWWHHGEFYDFGDLLTPYEVIDHIVAVSESSAEIVKSYYPSVADKVTVISNIVRIYALMEKSEYYQIDKTDKLTLVTIGRFSPEKNMIICPEIGKKLSEYKIDFLWYLIGDGVQLEETKKLIAQFELEDRFVFTGRINNPYPYLKAADILVHPSLVESQGLTVLEAMALETPVVVVKSAGPKEYIENGINGYLVDADCEQIADIIMNISQDKEMAEDLVHNAKDIVKEFSPEVIINKLQKLL